MDSLDRFRTRMNYFGNNLRDEKIKNDKELLMETFKCDPSYRNKIYRWSVGKKNYTNNDLVGIRIYRRSFSSANGVTMKFQTMIKEPVDVGDILYDKNKDKYYICTESFNIDEIHWQGKLTMCNWILKWQDKSGKILEYPCYDINATQYNSGERANSQFTIGSSQHMVTLPCDENTVVLSTPQRFFLDKNTSNPTSFIITQNDTTSYNYGNKGLIKITLYESVFNNETDRPDLGICDFNDNIEIDNDSNKKTSKSVIVCDNNIIKSGGNSKKFIGKFYDENNNIIDKKCKWNIICNFINELKIKEYDNCIEISIDNDYCIDEEFKLILTDNNNNCRSDMIIRIESLL